MSSEQNRISEDVRHSIKAFLDQSQREARPFAVVEALGALKRLSPQLDVPDEEWLETLQREASSAGFEVVYEADGTLLKINRSLESWENEGGAISHGTPNNRS